MEDIKSCLTHQRFLKRCNIKKTVADTDQEEILTHDISKERMQIEDFSFCPLNNQLVTISQS